MHSGTAEFTGEVKPRPVRTFVIFSELCACFVRPIGYKFIILHIYSPSEDPVDKTKRLRLIAKMLAQEAVTDQETLKVRLKRAGLSVSQSSLSRDLRSLGAQRLRRHDGSYYYTLPPDPPASATAEQFGQRFATSVTGVRRTGFLLVLFTPPGEAQLVGRLLDEADIPGLVGTVAGDDTIFVASDSERSAKKLETKFKELSNEMESL